MNKRILIAVIIFFILHNTRYYWEAIGLWSIPAMLILFLYFLILIFVFVRQIIGSVKERYSNKPRLILISILAVVIGSTIYKPDGILDYERLEGEVVLTADREGSANCRTILKLKENHKFILTSYCFGIDKVTGTYTVNHDTIYFKNASSSRKKEHFYEYALLKKSIFGNKQALYDLMLYSNKDDTVPNPLLVPDHVNNRKFCRMLMSNKITLLPKVSLPIKDTVTKTVVGYIDRQRFSINLTNKYDLYILNSKNDTIFKELGSAIDFEFHDFDRDGYRDARLYYMTNVPGIQNLLIYNPKSKSFKEVRHFDRFPNPHKIANAGYYYSYHRNGCADMDWVSDLFYIENYECVKIGSIKGYECGNSGIKDGIYISKTSGKQNSLIKELPIVTIHKYKSRKFGFIQDYWTKNYKLFID